jgi:AraC-like DNA-binding protein
VSDNNQRMIAVETFRATSVPVRRRLDYWNDLAHITHTPITVEPEDLGSYAPELQSVCIEDTSLGNVLSTASRISHTCQHVARTTAPMLFLQVQIEGRSSHVQNGREAHLVPGDFTLLDNTRPYHSHCYGQTAILVVGLPQPAMRQHLGCAEGVGGVRIPGASGANALVSKYLKVLWDQCHSGLEVAAAHHLVSALMHLVSSSYAALPSAWPRPTESRLSARLRAIRFIEAHLGDCDLTPQKVAAACGMTPRHLHRVFSDLDQTVGCYILRRRLEECARLLTTALHSGRTVGAIAMDCGFNSVNNFAKVFREHYGVTPTEYRKRCHTVLAREPLVPEV